MALAKPSSVTSPSLPAKVSNCQRLVEISRNTAFQIRESRHWRTVSGLGGQMSGKKQPMPCSETRGPQIIAEKPLMINFYYFLQWRMLSFDFRGVVRVSHPQLPDLGRVGSRNFYDPRVKSPFL